MRKKQFLISQMILFLLVLGVSFCYSLISVKKIVSYCYIYVTFHGAKPDQFCTYPLKMKYDTDTSGTFKMRQHYFSLSSRVIDLTGNWYAHSENKNIIYFTSNNIIELENLIFHETYDDRIPDNCVLIKIIGEIDTLPEDIFTYSMDSLDSFIFSNSGVVINNSQTIIINSDSLLCDLKIESVQLISLYNTISNVRYVNNLENNILLLGLSDMPMILRGEYLYKEPALINADTIKFMNFPDGFFILGTPPKTSE